MEGDLKMDILKGKRYDIMNVLWEEGRPLSAFEINDIAPELKMPTVRRCLELLLKENLIQVAGTSMNGKVYARNYTPLLSREDYLKGNAKSRKINPVEMMNALLESDGITVEELEKLQEIIQMNKVSIWLNLLSINYFLFCSTSFNIIARTFSGSPNSVMNPSASWWS